MKSLKHSDYSSSDKSREILEGIPTVELGQVVSDFESEGAVVETKNNNDGTWTVIATFKNREAY